MQSVIVFVSALAVASAGLIHAPYGVAPLAVGHVGANQYQAQDELGQYSYGYSGGPSAKTETKTADGVVRGAYSYVDGNGLVQSANYIADPVNGFRVAATNLPVGPVAPATPVVAGVRSIVQAPAATYYASPLAVPHFLPTTYTAAAAPAHNGAVHIANLPLPPADTLEVQIAKADHFRAHAAALSRA